MCDGNEDMLFLPSIVDSMHPIIHHVILVLVLYFFLWKTTTEWLLCV